MTIDEITALRGKRVRLRKTGSSKVIVGRVRRDVGHGYWEIESDMQVLGMYLIEEWGLVSIG